jgi:ABC-2 type transport system ATP-binding protein
VSALGTRPLAIEGHGLTMRYGSNLALDHGDVAIPAGTIFGLLGPNGAGKTTMIKLLTGLVPPTSGDATVAGFSVLRDPTEVKRRIGWVATEVILDDDLTAWENLWLQAKLQEVPDWRDRGRELLRYFRLADRAKDRVSKFSSGMRKKLEIALALLHRPSIVFMDEPTIGLDPATRRTLWELTRGINREFGVTVLLTTHYIEEADALCDTLGILDHGKIVAIGTPSELKARVQADRVEIEADGPIDRALFARVPGVIDLRESGKGTTLKVASAEASMPAILAALRDLPVRRLNVEKPSLETVFLELTGNRLAGDDAPVDVRKFYMTMRRARQ